MGKKQHPNHEGIEHSQIVQPVDRVVETLHFRHRVMELETFQ